MHPTGWGFVLAILAMTVAAFVEMARLQYAPTPGKRRLLLNPNHNPSLLLTCCYAVPVTAMCALHWCSGDYYDKSARDNISPCQNIDDYNPYNYQDWYQVSECLLLLCICMLISLCRLCLSLTAIAYLGRRHGRASVLPPDLRHREPRGRAAGPGLHQLRRHPADEQHLRHVAGTVYALPVCLLTLLCLINAICFAALLPLINRRSSSR